MAPTEARPLRWRIADRFSGRRGRRVILAAGLMLILLTGGLLLLRGFEGRPLLLNDDGSVRQRAVACAAPWKSVTAKFSKTDPRTPEEIRTCVEQGRLKVFTAFLFSAFIAVAAFGLSRLPEKDSRSGTPSAWEHALGEARRRQTERRDISSQR